MNYLSFLASRSLQQLPVVQPYLGSRFEPHRAEDSSITRSNAEYATFTSSASLPNHPAPHVPSSRFLIPERQEVIHPIESPIHSILRQPAPETRGELSGTIIDRSLPAAPVVPPLMQPQPVEVEIERQPAIKSEPEKITHSIERQIVHEKVIEHRQIIERIPERDKTITPMAPVIEQVTTHAVPVIPKVTPYVAPEPEQAAEVEQTPVIHVNIGRIEVRAIHTTPPVASEPPKTSQPKLSLDQYLRGEHR